MLMNASRSAIQGPTLPRRSKLAQSVAITQSKCLPAFGLSMSFSGSRKASLRGISSSFQQTTFLPWSCNAQASANCEPMQSPSGRTWPATQMDSLLRMTSRTFWINCLVLVSEIKVLLFAVFGWARSLLEFIDDPEHTVAAHHRIIHHEIQARDVFEKDRFGHEVLDTGAVLLQQGQAGALLFCAAQE